MARVVEHFDVIGRPVVFTRQALDIHGQYVLIATKYENINGLLVTKRQVGFNAKSVERGKDL